MMPAARLLESAVRGSPGVHDASVQMRREPTRWFHSAIDKNGVARVSGLGATEAKAAATAKVVCKRLENDSPRRARVFCAAIFGERTRSRPGWWCTRCG
jgi:hypothetical protein